MYKFNAKVIYEKDILLNKDSIKSHNKLFTTGLQLFLKSIEKNSIFLSSLILFFIHILKIFYF